MKEIFKITITEHGFSSKKKGFVSCVHISGIDTDYTETIVHNNQSVATNKCAYKLSDIIYKEFIK